MKAKITTPTGVIRVPRTRSGLYEFEFNGIPCKVEWLRSDQKWHWAFEGETNPTAYENKADAIAALELYLEMINASA